MSDWKQQAATRRDARNVRSPDEVGKPGAAKKDKKRWCRGKAGIEHKGVCRDYREVKGLGVSIPGFAKKWRLLVCTECGKELATYYAFGKSKKDPPAWVTF